MDHLNRDLAFSTDDPYHTAILLTYECYVEETLLLLTARALHSSIQLRSQLIHLVLAFEILTLDLYIFLEK